MKKLAIPAVCILVGFAFGLVTGCANTGIKHVSPERFISEAKTMEQINSASGTFYVGTSPTRAYVERTGLYKLFRLHKAMVYWTELEGLPPEIRNQLKEDQIPWTPWHEKYKKEDIGIGLPIAEEPSLITVRTDRVYGDSAVTDGELSEKD